MGLIGRADRDRDHTAPREKHGCPVYARRCPLLVRCTQARMCTQARVCMRAAQARTCARRAQPGRVACEQASEILVREHQRGPRCEHIARHLVLEQGRTSVAFVCLRM
eukprot:4912040-Pleurochrysis_carterae.AAC.12